MTRFRITSSTPGAENEPYDTETFAQKHGLSERAAEVVLFSNGPSRTACDAAARAFKVAVAAREKEVAIRRKPGR